MTKPLRDKNGKFIAKSPTAKKVVKKATPMMKSTPAKATPANIEFTVCPQCGKDGLVDVNSNIMGQNAYKTNKTIKMCKQCGLRIAV